LGTDDFTDLLALSFSSTDYIGHNFGVNAKETQDTYLRLDAEISRLLDALDQRVGPGEYTVFLTSDHGAVHVPAFLESNNITSGYLSMRDLRTRLNEFMTRTYKTDELIESVGNFQIFLNHQKIKALGLDLTQVQEALVNEVINYEHIDKAYSASTLHTNYFGDGVERMLQLGYHQKRSGDVLMVLNSAVISRGRKGTTHGSGYSYDTHVPLLFYGKGINKGSTVERTEITDIAATISAMLGVSFPNATIGEPISKAISE
jgi:predicted AlkP superfamily pyrophosphatase or phosphodiesterase